MFCSKCGASNSDSANFCAGCGSPLASPTIIQSGLTSPIQDLEAFYRSFIGTNNQSYYLNNFLRFEKEGKISGSWHWPAFFLTFYWFLYRKMWLNALIYFLLPYLMLIPVLIISVMLGKGGETIVVFCYFVLVLSLFIFPPIYANALYYKHTKKKIAEILIRNKDYKSQQLEVAAKGGTSKAILIIACLMMFIAIIGILAAIAIPSYSDYVNKAKTVQAISIGKQATIAVADYYYNNKEVPKDLNQTRFSVPFDPNVRSLVIDPSSGVITLTLASTNISLNDKSILFVPSLDSSKPIIWKCMSQEIEARRLPNECRE